MVVVTVVTGSTAGSEAEDETSWAAAASRSFWTSSCKLFCLALRWLMSTWKRKQEKSIGRRSQILHEDGQRDKNEKELHLFLLQDRPVLHRLLLDLDLRCLQLLLQLTVDSPQAFILERKIVHRPHVTSPHL